MLPTFTEIKFCESGAVAADLSTLLAADPLDDQEPIKVSVDTTESCFMDQAAAKNFSIDSSACNPVTW